MPRKSYAKKVYKRAKIYGKAGRQLYRDVKMLKSMVNVERKFFDVQTNDTSIAADWEIFPMALMGEGDDWNQRNGRKIKASSIYFNGQIYIDPDSSKTNVRVVLFYDKGANGAVPDWSEIFSYNDIQSPLNPSNAGSRFVIIADKSTDLSINGNETRTLKIYRKLRHHVTYLGTTNTNGNIGPGQLFLAYISNETDTALQPTINYINRFRYIDN